MLGGGKGGGDKRTYLLMTLSRRECKVELASEDCLPPA